MKCVQCNSNTSVVNSRPNEKLHRVWRRRACKSCGITFTTWESVQDYDYSFMVISGKDKSAFSLPRLMVSLNSSMSHREQTTSPQEAYWLAATIAQQVSARAERIISTNALAVVACDTLYNFDRVAGLSYGAKHRVALLDN